MTEKELKDLIVSQAKEIQELKEELEITESLRRFGWSRYQEARAEIDELEKKLGPKSACDESKHKPIYGSVDADILSIGLTD